MTKVFWGSLDVFQVHVLILMSIHGSDSSWCRWSSTNFYVWKNGEKGLISLLSTDKTSDALSQYGVQTVDSTCMYLLQATLPHRPLVCDEKRRGMRALPFRLSETKPSHVFAELCAVPQIFFNSRQGEERRRNKTTLFTFFERNIYFLLMVSICRAPCKKKHIIIEKMTKSLHASTVAQLVQMTLDFLNKFWLFQSFIFVIMR